MRNGECQNQPVICNQNEDCFIRCDQRNSCWFSSIQCPPNNKCNVHCGIARNSCDDIIINATQSTSLYIYCQDNECDDAYIYCPTSQYNMNLDHQCILTGIRTIDRITFYTQQGFNDINIENIPLEDSTVICGENGEYQCTINATQNGCLSNEDKTCQSYRLPTPSPSLVR